MKQVALTSSLLILAINSQSAPVCGYPGAALVATESMLIELSAPKLHSSSLVVFSVEPGFVLLAEKSDFVSIAKAWGKRQPNQLDVHELYAWIERQPQTKKLINLHEFDADHSEKRRRFMMELAMTRKVYVRLENSDVYVTRAILQSWACKLGGGKGLNGGKRLIDSEGRTLLWTSEWIA